MNEIVHTALAWAIVACSPVASCEAPESVRAVALQEQAQDPWLASDKFTHAGVSWAAAAFAFATARAAGLDRDDALTAAVPGTLALGVAKELFDRRRTSFSVPDLVADAVGVAAAYFFLREVR